MATIYLIDNELEAITVERAEEFALARARGILFVKDAKNHSKKMNETYLAEEKAYWLQFEGSKMYCLVR